MKFRVISADPPWPFDDKLSMSKVKRGAEANYSVMTMEDIKNLPVKYVSDDDSVLALWVPGSLLQDGLDTMEAWGYSHRQTHIWVKTKKNPLDSLSKSLRRTFREHFKKGNVFNAKSLLGLSSKLSDSFDISNILAFGMGHLFRQTHELVLVGVKGKGIYKHLKNRSQRSVHFHPATKHSAKPEALQDSLDLMFPDGERLEIFARRVRPNWTCMGNECASTLGEDVRDSLKSLMTDEEVEAHEKELVDKENKKFTAEAVSKLIKVADKKRLEIT